MNIAIIFAGGSGTRMNARSKPKQFLELHGKPIIIYTLEVFENHRDVDGIIVICVEDWIDYLKKMLNKFDITKVKDIVAGGATGQESIYNGLKSATQNFPKDSIILIHDGVRPLIDDITISENIRIVREKGSCITCVPATETLIVVQEDNSLEIPSRKNSFLARAPQSFVLQDIWNIHQKAREENRNDFIDSCTMMSHYGKELATVIGPMENIKITTPADFYIFRAIEEVRENSQIFGI
jgi:2-C-methyl-D-erythritol 4-phosphate cytidylyltransferase